MGFSSKLPDFTPSRYLPLGADEIPNPKTNKIGIRTHNKVSAFVLNLFSFIGKKVMDVPDGKGGIVHLNRASLNNWLRLHGKYSGNLETDTQYEQAIQKVRENAIKSAKPAAEPGESIELRDDKMTETGRQLKQERPSPPVHKPLVQDKQPTQPAPPKKPVGSPNPEGPHPAKESGLAEVPREYVPGSPSPAEQPVGSPNPEGPHLAKKPGKSPRAYQPPFRTIPEDKEYVEAPGEYAPGSPSLAERSGESTHAEKPDPAEGPGESTLAEGPPSAERTIPEKSEPTPPPSGSPKLKSLSEEGMPRARTEDRMEELAKNELAKNEEEIQKLRASMAGSESPANSAGLSARLEKSIVSLNKYVRGDRYEEITYHFGNDFANLLAANGLDINQPEVKAIIEFVKSVCQRQERSIDDKAKIKEEIGNVKKGILDAIRANVDTINFADKGEVNLFFTHGSGGYPYSFLKEVQEQQPPLEKGKFPKTIECHPIGGANVAIVQEIAERIVNSKAFSKALENYFLGQL